MNESDTRLHKIDPKLKAAGWGVTSDYELCYIACCIIDAARFFYYKLNVYAYMPTMKIGGKKVRFHR
jgi:hypothetical protein